MNFGKNTTYIAEIHFLTGGKFKTQNFANTNTDLNNPSYTYKAADRIYFEPKGGTGAVKSFLFLP